MDWQGNQPEDRSWIPRNQILDPTLEFYRAHPEKPGRALGDAPRGGGDVGVRSGTLTQLGHERAQTGTGRREMPADGRCQLTAINDSGQLSGRPSSLFESRAVVKPTREDNKRCFSPGDQHHERFIVPRQPGQPPTEPSAGIPKASPALNPGGVPLH